MVRPTEVLLTKNEIEVMKILWCHPKITVRQILEKVKRSPKPAYTSLLTLMQNMLKKKLVIRIEKGKAYIYSAAIKKDKYIASEVKTVSKRLFDSGPFSLVMNLVNSNELTKEEIAELKKMLE